MEVRVGSGGIVNFNALQQQWHGGSLLMQSALFAGHTMIVLTDDNGGFKLHYLDCESEQFSSMEEAKTSASEFAVAVLEYMIQFIERGKREDEE